MNTVGGAGQERRRFELRIDSDPANLAPARKAVEQFAANNGFAQQAVHDVGLCLNEALANVMRHAYGGRTDRPILITAEATASELTVSVRDWGNGIDPSRLPHRPYDPLEPGGVGLICLNQWMDEVKYTPQPDGMLTMLKRRIDKGRR